MDVKAENLTLDSVLKKGKFTIPDYQREYEWADEEISEFLENLSEIKNDEKYFIGHMVLEVDKNGKDFNVVDGQQRLTTITILLCALRDLLFDKNSEKFANPIHEQYIFNKDRDGSEFGILINDMPYPVFQKRIQVKSDERDHTVIPKRSGEEKILKAYNIFINTFQNYTVEELIIVRDKILNLEVIFVAVKETDDGDSVDAHEIFMTLNATGKDLTSLDLIKGRVYKLYPKNKALKEPNETWTKIIDNTRGENPDSKNPSKKSLKFLNNFFSYRYEKVSDKKIYKLFVNKVIKNKEDIKLFLSNLHSDSENFNKIINPNPGDWKNDEFKIFFSINAITNVFGIEVSNPMLLSLIKAYKDKLISKAYFLKALNSIERYHFINNAIVSGRSSGLDKKYSKYARDILFAKNKQEKHKVIDDFIGSLVPPNIDSFKAAFDDKLHYSSSHISQKKLVQYALQKLEYKLNPNCQLLNISIEHIHPQKSKDKSVPLELIGNIGNLVLLDRDLNSDSKVGNKSYDEKRKVILKYSTILTTKNVFKENKKWNSNKISSRKNALIDELYENVWK